MNFIFYVLVFILFPFIAQSQIKLEKITPELSNLWGVSVLNKEEVLFTQRAGKLFRLNVFKKEIYEVKGVPKVFNYGQGGLLDIAIEETNNKKIIYLCFSKINKNSESATAINSYEFQNDELFNKKQIFVSNKFSRSSRHFGCRLAINNNHIFATIGDRGKRNDSQNLKNHSGSVIKIFKNGNYYNNKSFQNSLPEIYSIGHRNPQGLTFNIDKTHLWLHEHGPQGGDELNIVLKGKNYGWPKVTFGKEYGSGRSIGIGTSKVGYKDPVKVWIPSIAPSGMVFYKGNMFPEFEGKLLLGSLKFKQLHVLSLKNNIVVNEIKILSNKIGRIRDLQEMSDGSIIIINDEFNGGVYRLYKQ
ncbi:PQQ-dependent sugar dehydrogenase [Alphaproteobacteria bacterium]|nr:PQQ-dependent sugar dehydrogenase [Alphaproteobacteria bacterium]MDC1086872.1 PQQ-dependent sugar dehydrogenase [Alphaproteobacteria bacterium]